MTTNLELSSIAAELSRLKGEKDRLEELLKACNARIEQITKHELPELMAQSEIDRFSVPGVGSVHLQQRVYANVKVEDRDAFHDWLTEHGYQDIITESVHPSTLSAFAKERMESGEELPDCVRVTPQTVAVLRRG